jgi:hypothetical protein
MDGARWWRVVWCEMDEEWGQVTGDGWKGGRWVSGAKLEPLPCAGVATQPTISLSVFRSLELGVAREMDGGCCVLKCRCSGCGIVMISKRVH